MKNLFYLLRPHQWLKNLFVLVGIIFAHAWQNTTLLKQAIVTVFAFCFLAGTVYIFNDIIDRAADRTHPIKKLRPLAAGTVSVTQAIILAIIVASIGLVLGFMTSNTVGWLLLTYAVLNIAYSKFFKRQVILDVFAIAAGFLLRILAGTIGIGIQPSGWLLFCSFMLTLFLGFCKRQSDLKLLNTAQLETPLNLQHYSKTFLDKLITITAAGAIVSYTLYSLQQDNLLHDGAHRFIYTVPFVIFGIFRYLYVLESKSNSGIDMARDLLRDPQLFTTVTAWLLIVITIGLK